MLTEVLLKLDDGTRFTELAPTTTRSAINIDAVPPVQLAI